MNRTRNSWGAGVCAVLLLFCQASNAQELAAFELDQSSVRVNTLGDVKLIRTADTPREVRVIKTREYQASTCTEYTRHETMGTCYTRTPIPNPRTCSFYETYTTYGPFGSIHVQRRCVLWVGGGRSTIETPYSCPTSRQVCSKSEMQMRVGTIEFTFIFRRMHRLGPGEVEEYLLTEENLNGRSSWDFRIVNSNGRRYEITRDGTQFELRRQ